MVDFADLQRADRLRQDIEDIDRALAKLASNGVIADMTVADAPDEATGWVGETVRVSTLGVPYPPQMLEGIGNALRQRQQENRDELQRMGVTIPESTST